MMTDTELRALAEEVAADTWSWYRERTIAQAYLALSQEKAEMERQRDELERRNQELNRAARLEQMDRISTQSRLYGVQQRLAEADAVLSVAWDTAMKGGDYSHEQLEKWEREAIVRHCARVSRPSTRTDRERRDDVSDLVCQVCKEAVPTGWMRSGDPDAWYLQNVAPNAASGGTMRPIHVRCASRSIDCPTCAGSGHVQDAQLVMSNWHNRAHAAESALAAALARIAALEEARRVLEEVVRVAETSYAEAIEIARTALAEPGKPDERGGRRREHGGS